MFDCLFRNARIIDGSGNRAYTGDLAVKDGKIAAIGHNLGPSACTVDAEGRCLTPGFIDIHRHGDAAVFRRSFGDAELYQGLTSIVNGACGLSLVPFGAEHREDLLRYLKPVVGSLDPNIPTNSVAEYLQALSRQPLALNIGTAVGGGTVRTDVYGYTAGDPASYAPIHRRLEQALCEGALAVSLGLGYAPECFYSTDGLIRALAPLENTSIPVCVHLREEGDMVCEAIEEMITVAKALNCPLHISHLKAMGMRNWKHRIPRALEIMDRARQEGLSLSCDVYLYEAGSTQLLHLLPPDFLAGGVDAICQRLRDPRQRALLKERIAYGRDFDNIAQMIGWENIILSSLQLPRHQSYIGLTVEEVSKKMKMDPVDCICHLLSEENCAVTMIDRINCEEDILQILKDPYSAVISDATYPEKGLPHPRVYGNCTRLFDRFVNELHTLSIEEAVRKVTSLPAQIMGIRGKGLLQVGLDADLNLFYPENLKEKGNYLNPRQYAEGMDYVFVMGEAVILKGKRTACCPGKVIKR